MRQPNLLIRETSPYLLQHAYNPVQWHAWNEETLLKARNENKPLLISIGYSSCHWCHVMEKESFEDQEVAHLMNEHFVCIKIDREERPDVDQIYMQAVQLISGHGGWPLNCFALPDGRPFWGGTYFKRNNWMYILSQIAKMFADSPEEVISHAEKLTSGIKTDDWLGKECHPIQYITTGDLDQAFINSKTKLDLEYGGLSGTPKFPMPSNLVFLLRYFHLTKKQEVMDFIELTLNRMAQGGIYDQLGGGFSRYSTDPYWKVPHFEKMLYDNAQLISLYSEAYRLKPESLWKEAALGTIGFIRDHLTAPEGVFYAAMDADSEGGEGNYYVWTARQIRQLLGSEAGLAMDYFHIKDEGNWEEGKNVLFCPEEEDIIAAKNHLSERELHKRISAIRQNLLQARKTRPQPGLDDKVITSWNAMMIRAYLDAWMAFRETAYLESAIKAMDFLLERLRKDDGGLYHTWKSGTAKVEGMLDDYASMIDALLSLYQVTFDKKWLSAAGALTDYALSHFQDPDSGMLYYTPDTEKSLIARKFEWIDNVIPSSNSVMARNLYYLGKLMSREDYLNRSARMAKRMHNHVKRYLLSFSNWGILSLEMASPFYTVAITGKKAFKKLEELSEYYFPRKVMTGSPEPSELPNLKDRFVANETLIFICSGESCLQPTREVKDAIASLT